MKKFLLIILILTLFGFCSEYRAESILQRFAKRLAYWWDGSIDPTEITWVLDRTKYGNLFKNPRILRRKKIGETATLWGRNYTISIYTFDYIVDKKDQDIALAILREEPGPRRRSKTGILAQLLFKKESNSRVRIEDIFIVDRLTNEEKLERFFIDFILDCVKPIERYVATKEVLAKGQRKGFFSRFGPKKAQK